MSAPLDFRSRIADQVPDPGLTERVLNQLTAWMTRPEFAAYRPQIEWLATHGRWPDLLDCFYQMLPFGTGGRRGAVGIGPNRMNHWTVGASVQGHCDYLKQRFPGVSELHVVIAYDVRRFLDQRKVFNPNLPNPVLGVSSKDFAHHAAGVYAANGIHVHLLPPDSPRYMSTPEMSSTIRQLSAHGGLNLTASHNPPDDNGLKFSDERGGQPVPPDDQIMSDIMESASTIRHLPWPEAIRSGRVHFLDEQCHRGYIEQIRKTSLIPPPRFDEFQLVFTPLHGVGSMSAQEVLEAQGFRTIPVPEQMTPDGLFPNVTRSPNPEVPESMDRAERTALACQADLVLATDPDADRLGGIARVADNHYRYITGNEICSLLAYFKLAKLAEHGRLPRSPILAFSLVTTSQVTRIGHHFGAQVADDLLVGFKYIADLLAQLEERGQFEDIRGTPEDFVLGVEESHGILVTPHIRDKDAAGGCLLFAELALDQKRKGQTVIDLLDEINARFGYFRNEVINIIMTGLEGKRQMHTMLNRLRADPPHQLAGIAITGMEDLLDPNGRLGPIKGATDAAARNVLVFQLGEIGKVILRPSGTEPKAKAYIEIRTPPRAAGLDHDAWLDQCRAADQRIQAIADEFLKLTLGLVDQSPPPGHVRLSR